MGKPSIVGQIGLVALILIFLLADVAHAQRVSFPPYRPGEYAPLRIESESAGRIEIRGPEMTGIVWDAPGKTSIVVPWMCWRATSADVPVTVNGKTQVVPLRPLQDADPAPQPNPYAGTAWGAGPTSAMYAEEAYSPTFSWTPGRPEQTRRWIVLAAVLAFLMLLAIRLAMWRSRWTAAVMLVAGVGLAMLFSQRSELSRRDSRMTIRITSANPSQSDTWTYLTSSIEQRLEVPWIGTPMLIPWAAVHLDALDPVVQIDSSGLPAALSVKVRTDLAAAVLMRTTDDAGIDSVTADDSVVAPELVRQLYGRGYTVDRTEGVVMRLTPSSGQ